MKLVFITGDTAVGKMTTGQELMKITDLKLFHNHMMIEPVVEVFGEFNIETITKLRKVVFEDFAKSDNYAMIYTFIWAFDHKSDWDALEKTKKIFEPYGTEFYYVELIAPQEIRLKRNTTENRLNNKKSKRDIEFSNQLLIDTDKNLRCVSYEGEIPFDNYLRIDNSDKSPEEVSEYIKEKFNL